MLGAEHSKPKGRLAHALTCMRVASQVTEYVEDVLTIMELDTIRGLLVGIPGQDGLSVEQRKRLTIAVELVANPSVVFMDEPTSGKHMASYSKFDESMLASAFMPNDKKGTRGLLPVHQIGLCGRALIDVLSLLEHGS